MEGLVATQMRDSRFITAEDQDEGMELVHRLVVVVQQVTRSFVNGWGSIAHKIMESTS